ncbi:MAG: hypothetical protein MJ223_00255 [Mycoplasmoidaceae bacterium]|nr:hypothetical protein [Mycoplasmoidaceae bacterium]
MKLHTKVITAFTPLAVLGVSIPAITSCSCSNDPYSINYGQDINCLYSNKDGYKSLNAVQDAVKSHADVHEEGDITQAQLNTASSI